MKPGTYIRLPDGREGTTVYNGLDGVGIVWGKKRVNIAAIKASCPLFSSAEPHPEAPEAEAMLRKPYPGAWCECVGDDYEVIGHMEEE